MKKAILLALLALGACAPVDCGPPETSKTATVTTKSVTTEKIGTIEEPVRELPEQAPVMPSPKKK